MRFPTFLILSTSLLLFTGCGTKTPEDNTAKTTTPEQAAQTAVDQAKSATEKATSTAQTELDKAKSATEQTTSTANATLDKAKSATEQATNQAQSKMNEMKSAVDKAKQSTTKAVQGAIALKDGVQGMSSGVTNTLAAVKAGDLNTAKQEFTKLQGDWTTIEGAVKTKSAKAYEEINGHMTILGKLFKSGKPDANAAQLTTELQALGKSLTTSLMQK